VLDVQHKMLRKLAQLAHSLNIPAVDHSQIIDLMDTFLDGKYGQGKYMELVVGSCIYAFCRRTKRPITLMDTAVCHSVQSFDFLFRKWSRFAPHRALRVHLG